MRRVPFISGRLRTLFPRDGGRLGAALVLAVGLLSFAGAARAADHGSHGHGGFHGREFHDRDFHDRDFHHWGWGWGWAGDPYYYPDPYYYAPYYDAPYYYAPYYYSPPYYAPPPVVQSYPTSCQNGQWRTENGSVVSGTACLQPDGSWKMVN